MWKKLISPSKPQVLCVCDATSCPREWKKTFIDGLKWFSISSELGSRFFCVFSHLQLCRRAVESLSGIRWEAKVLFKFQLCGVRSHRN